jgi:threonine/homoserine/homoserine lactone efflux protein
MTYESLLGLVAFALVTSITPGPNNLMLMASGANFGVRRTLPHACGVALGFVVMAIAMGAGLHRLFVLWPQAQWALKAAAVVYMLWLAWKIAHAAAPGEAQAKARPMTFWQAMAFQWVNPKAWSMAVTATTVYVADGSLQAVVLASVIFGLVNLPSVGLWAVAGQTMRRWLTNPTRLRAFNGTMAALLIASLWPILTH